MTTSGRAGKGETGRRTVGRLSQKQIDEIYDAVPIATANEVVKRWDAFEPGGAVALAREALKWLLEIHDQDPISCYSEQMEQARRALAALDAVEGK